MTPPATDDPPLRAFRTCDADLPGVDAPTPGAAQTDTFRLYPPAGRHTAGRAFPPTLTGRTPPRPRRRGRVVNEDTDMSRSRSRSPVPADPADGRQAPADPTCGQVAPPHGDRAAPARAQATAAASATRHHRRTRPAPDPDTDNPDHWPVRPHDRTAHHHRRDNHHRRGSHHRFHPPVADAGSDSRG